MWEKRSLCRGEDPELWFSTDEEHRSKLKNANEIKAIEVCKRCPVQGNCLQVALVEKRIGIWGGTTTHERKSLSRPGWRVVCVRCQSRNLEKVGEFQVCLTCGCSKMT